MDCHSTYLLEIASVYSVWMERGSRVHSTCWLVKRRLQVGMHSFTGTVWMTTGNWYAQWGMAVTNTQATQSIGYCAQADALISEMTGRETLFMFARLRGISEPEGIVNAVIQAIGIRKYADRTVKTYRWCRNMWRQWIHRSGGNKRRLSVGVALCGLPDILLLDEPTTGVDPRARRTIWEILSKVETHTSVTHNQWIRWDRWIKQLYWHHTAWKSVKHCVRPWGLWLQVSGCCLSILSLCNAGRFRCFGTPQHVMSRYGINYKLVIRVKNAAHCEVTSRQIEAEIPGAVLKVR